jgi:hypothetical protein
MFTEKKRPSKLEKLMMAVTFAEAGERVTALEMMGKEPDKRQEKRIMFDKKLKPTRLEKLMMAVTFAEAGERVTALEMMGKEPDKRQQKRIRRRQDKRTDRRPGIRS